MGPRCLLVRRSPLAPVYVHAYSRAPRAPIHTRAAWTHRGTHTRSLLVATRRTLLCMGRCLIYGRRVSGLLSVVRETANSPSMAWCAYLANIPLSNWNWLGGPRRVAPRNKDGIADRPTIDFRAFSVALFSPDRARPSYPLPLHPPPPHRTPYDPRLRPPPFFLYLERIEIVDRRYNDRRSLPYPRRHGEKEERGCSLRTVHDYSTSPPRDMPTAVLDSVIKTGSEHIGLWIVKLIEMWEYFHTG